MNCSRSKVGIFFLEAWSQNQLLKRSLGHEISTREKEKNFHGGEFLNENASKVVNTRRLTSLMNLMISTEDVLFSPLPNRIWILVSVFFLSELLKIIPTNLGHTNHKIKNEIKIAGKICTYFPHFLFFVITYLVPP